MGSQDSVTTWIGRLQQGDHDAAQRIFERYHRRLLGLALKRLAIRRDPRRAEDEHDVVQDAFQSFFRRTAQGAFPQLQDRDDLWQLLVAITAKKISFRVRRSLTAKRGGGTVRGDSVFDGITEDGGLAGFDQFIGNDPSGEFAAEMVDSCEHMLAALSEGQLQQIAISKMEGFTNDELAAKFGISRATVERKLGLIRKMWTARGFNDYGSSHPA